MSSDANIRVPETLLIQAQEAAERRGNMTDDQVEEMVNRAISEYCAESPKR